jgi:hypothetical protein
MDGYNIKEPSGEAKLQGHPDAWDVIFLLSQQKKIETTCCWCLKCQKLIGSGEIYDVDGQVNESSELWQWDVTQSVIKLEKK